MVGDYSYLKYIINTNEGVTVNALHLVQRVIKYFNFILSNILYCTIMDKSVPILDKVFKLL